MKLHFGHVYVLWLIIMLLTASVLGCTEKPTEHHEDYFYSLIKLKAGEEFVFAKIKNVDYSIKYTGWNGYYFIFEWDKGYAANKGDLIQTYITIKGKMFFIHFISITKEQAIIYMEEYIK